MINNNMLEGKQGFATLEDVDEGTLTRFIEWLYRGYYHAAAPKQVPQPEQPSESSDSQTAQEGSSKRPAFSFGTAKPTFSGVDATDALRGVFSASATSEPPRSLFGGATPTSPTAEPPRGNLLFGGATPTSPTAEPPRGTLIFGGLGSVGATQVTPSSLNGNATSEKAERAARRAIDNSVPLWQGPNPFGVHSEAPNILGDSATSDPDKKISRKSKDRNSSPGSVTQNHSLHAKELFVQRKYTIRQTVKSLPLPRRQDPFHQEQEDFSEVFLCHAHLHVFADKYDIQMLKVLALEELHATLAVFTLHQERTGDILNLLRYVYKEAPEQANKMEDLRTLITQYVESEFGTLVKDVTLGKYLSEGDGEFLEDFLNILRKRLA